MTFAKKAVLWACVSTLIIPVFMLMVAYGVNSNMSAPKLEELYNEARSICENPYSTAAYTDRMEDYQDQILSLEARAERDDQLELAARLQRTLPFAEVQTAALLCEGAVMRYLSEVRSREADSFEEHWSWRARLHANCSRIMQEISAEKFLNIRKPVSQALNEETFPDLEPLQGTTHRRLLWQPWRVRALMRMCQ